MSGEKAVIKSKWLTILAFLTLDALQIFFVSILSFNERLDWIITIDPTLPNPAISVSIFVSIVLIQLILAYYLTLAMLRSKSMISLYPDYDKEREAPLVRRFFMKVKLTKRMLAIQQLVILF